MASVRGPHRAAKLGKGGNTIVVVAARQWEPQEFRPVDTLVVAIPRREVATPIPGCPPHASAMDATSGRSGVDPVSMWDRLRPNLVRRRPNLAQANVPDFGRVCTNSWRILVPTLSRIRPHFAASGRFEVDVPTDKGSPGPPEGPKRRPRWRASLRQRCGGCCVAARDSRRPGGVAASASAASGCRAGGLWVRAGGQLSESSAVERGGESGTSGFGRKAKGSIWLHNSRCRRHCRAVAGLCHFQI